MKCNQRIEITDFTYNGAVITCPTICPRRGRVWVGMYNSFVWCIEVETEV